jgi:predicted dehydrogenase
MQQLGVALIGHSFMGAVHSQAWRTVGHVYDLPARPAMTVLAGRRAEAAAHSAERLGWRDSTDDWKSLLRRDDVDIVDICTPGDSHAEIAVAALDAGKHVLCEKPLANTVAEAETMAAAARRAAEQGVRAMAGFTYRRVRALALARRLIALGRLGEIRHVRACSAPKLVATG